MFARLRNHKVSTWGTQSTGSWLRAKAAHNNKKDAIYLRRKHVFAETGAKICSIMFGYFWYHASPPSTTVKQFYNPWPEENDKPSHPSHSLSSPAKMTLCPKTSDTSIPSCSAPNSAMWGRVVQANACKQVQEIRLETRWCTVQHCSCCGQTEPQVCVETSIDVRTPRK